MLIIISSPSGAGKTTICKELLNKDKNIKISISDTTRVPRDDEINGKDYNFVSELEFKSKIKRNEYVEYAKVFGNFYGSLHSNVIELSKKNYDIIFDIDWQGAQQLKTSGYKNIISFFIIPPSRNVIYERLLARAVISGDDKDAINRRMSFYDTEVSHQNEYSHIIVNDNLDQCVKEIHELILIKRSNLGSVG